MQIESDRAFLGSVKVAIGPFTTSYKGRVEFAEVDESLHRARLTAEGQERGGGAAHGSMVSSLRTVEEGTEVVVDASVDGASRIMQMGLGLTQNLAQELFGQFVTCVKERLEGPLGATSTGGTSVGTAPARGECGFLTAHPPSGWCTTCRWFDVATFALLSVVACRLSFGQRRDAI